MINSSKTIARTRSPKLACIKLGHWLILLLGVLRVANAEWMPVHILGAFYPEVAQQARVEGTVVVFATLADDGKVTEVVRVSGPDILGPSALSSARRWRFKRNGVTTGSTVTIEFEFKLVGTCVLGSCKQEVQFDWPARLSIISEAPVPSHGKLRN
jgi:TonB family protein